MIFGGGVYWYWVGECLLNKGDIFLVLSDFEYYGIEYGREI